MPHCTAYETGIYQAGEGGLLTTDGRNHAAQSLRAVIQIHGRGGTATGWGPTDAGNSFEHARLLAETGRYAVYAIDAAGLATWSDPAAITAIDNAVTHALATFGSGTKVGLMGASMGSGATLNYIKAHPTRVCGAQLWCPSTDLDWAYSLSGYTPAYGSALPNNATWTADITTDYGITGGNPGNYTTQAAGHRIRDEYATWRNFPLQVLQADNDSVIPTAQTDAFVTGVGGTALSRVRTATGDHTGVWAKVDPAVTLAFYDSLTWN